MLNSDRQDIENIFFDYMKNSGFFYKPELTFLPSKTDKSLYFTNATVANFKDDLLNGNNRKLFTKQKCLRLHNTSKVLDKDFQVEWLSLFNMVGCLIPPEHLDYQKQNFIKMLTEAYKIDGKKLFFLVNSRDVNLYKNIPTQMLIFDNHPEKYYNWTFGMPEVDGQGLTFAFKQENGKLIDVGNLIQIKNSEKILGYEFAFGLECFQWAKEGYTSIFDAYPIFDGLDKNNNELVKCVDTVLGISAIESVNIEPSNKDARGQILKKLYRNLVYLAENCSLNNRDVRNIFIKSSQSEFDAQLNISRIMKNYSDSKALVNCQRNAFSTRKETLIEMYKSGQINQAKLQEKLLKLANGTCYIAPHERKKYFNIQNSDSNIFNKSLPILQYNQRSKNYGID